MAKGPRDDDDEVNSEPHEVIAVVVILVPLLNFFLVTAKENPIAIASLEAAQSPNHHG